MIEKGITNVYIDKIMSQISSSYKGTFACNVIPYFDNQTFSLIINLSTDREKGSHFISLFVLKNKIVYFDSYGLKNNNKFVEKYLQKYNKQIIYSNKTIQHISSAHCGYFAMSFILSLENNISLIKFLSFFRENNLIVNDYICVKIIKYFIKNSCI